MWRIDFLNSIRASESPCPLRSFSKRRVRRERLIAERTFMKTLAVDLAYATTVTLALGVAGIFFSDLLRTNSWRPTVSLLALICSVVAGVAVIVLRRRTNVAPIAAVFTVVMFGVLFWIGFVLDWRRGRIEF